MKNALILLVLCWAALASPAQAQRNCWGKSVANAVALPAALAQPQALSVGPLNSLQMTAPAFDAEWKQSGPDFHLFRFGKLVGAFSGPNNAYYRWDQGRWVASECPVQIPDAVRATGAVSAKATSESMPKEQAAIGQGREPDPPKAEGLVLNELPTGADWAKISKSPRVTFKGEVVSQDTAKGLIEGKKSPSDLVDDSAKDRLTFMATSKEKRSAAMKAFRAHPAYAKLRHEALAWEGDPQDWSFDPGFPRADNQVILQNPQGKVLARAQVDDVADPVQVIGALRKARPDYDPAKDPTPTKPDGKDGSLDVGSIPVEWMVLGGLGLLLVLISRR